MTAATRILIVGGGFSGMAAAIMLARGGAAVDLVEIDPDWRNYGAGISLHGATLRVLQKLGLLERFRAVGAMNSGLVIRRPDNDAVIAAIPTPQLPGTDLPGNAAILRPALAALLREATLDAGAAVRCGVTFETVEERQDGVHVVTTDGESRCYDAVIAADGLSSAMRRVLFPLAPAPAYVGQGVWRAVLETPPEISSLNMWMTKGVKAGINPVSQGASYLFLTEDRPVNERVSEESLLDGMKALLARFPSPILSRVAEGLSAESRILYRPLERLLLPQPWSRGRVMLIGDAVHATTPHLGAGALIGMEDGLSIAEELLRHDDVGAAFAAHEKRRWARCAMVVENSGRLAEIEMTGGDQGEHNDIMRRSVMVLAEPF